MIDLRTASVDEMRDWLAERIDGGVYKKKGDRWYHAKWHVRGSGQKSHPIPATLDAIADVWRTELVGWEWQLVGWEWLNAGDNEQRDIRRWYAYSREKPNLGIAVTFTGDELADRMRLTCLALAAERGIK